jgi:hypothetical protein
MRFILISILTTLFFSNAYAEDDFALSTTAFLDTGAMPVMYTLGIIGWFTIFRQPQQKSLKEAKLMVR